MTRLFAGGVGRVRLGLLGLMLAAAVMGGFALWEYRAVHRIRSEYVSATATVETLHLSEWVGSDENNRFAFTFTPAVRYRFHIGDTVHTGTRVHYQEGNLVGREAAEAFRTKYAPGASVECFHDPADPDEVLLIKPTNTDDAVGRLRISAVLFLLAAVGGVAFELTAGRTATRPSRRRPLEWQSDTDGYDPLARTRRTYRDKLEGD